MLSPFFGYGNGFRVFDSLEREMSRALTHSVRHEGSSTMRLRDHGEALTLVVDLPGVQEKDVDITIEGDVLTLRAEVGSAAPEGFQLVRRERQRMRFHEQIELPVRVDAEAVRATLTDGVLTLELPKAADARPRKIAIGYAQKPASA